MRHANRYRGKISPEIQQEFERYAASVLFNARLSGFLHIQDVGPARRQLIALSELLQEHPGQARKIKALVFARIDDRAWAYWDKTRLIFGTATYELARFESDIERGWIHASLETDPAAYIVAHEFGHVLAEGSQAQRLFRAYLQQWAGAMGDKALDAAVEAGAISLLGGTNLADALAEGFATMMSDRTMRLRSNEWRTNCSSDKEVDDVEEISDQG